MAHVPPSTTPYHIKFRPEAYLGQPPKSPSHSDPESPRHSAPLVLIAELEILCDLLKDLETKIAERLAPIMRPIGPDAPEDVYPAVSDFSPLFRELFIMIRAAQNLAGRNHDLIDRVETL